jgi:hypothetical protein
MTKWYDPKNWIFTEGGFVYEREGIEVTEIVLPEIPPEVWNERPIDAERAMAAVRAMCG